MKLRISVDVFCMARAIRMFYTIEIVFADNAIFSMDKDVATIGLFHPR